MPPSHHSSSSHSSHSSHSSRSSSSRSSFSSSSRSSSSRSSYSSGTRTSGGGWSSSRGPGGHSSTSHSSRPVGGGAFSQRGRAPSQPSRPRVNQPAGYNAGRNVSPPRYIYGRRHEYIYYPVAWIDAGTGTRYEKGYYDESGNRYEDVAFQKNGNYENVLCHCPYCEQDTLINLSVKDVESRSLQCPNCGGAMEIRSALDDAVQNTAGTADRKTYTDQPVQPRKRGRGCLFSVVIVLIVMFVMGVIGERLTDSPSQEPVQIVSGQDGSVDYNRRSTLYLVRTGDNSYRVTDSGDSADKTMKWDSYQESFYDPETECWIWYNTELEEPVWQYWVEGISSDYGDYGWMEHDWDGWWIEAGYGDWIELPAKYDASRLWYID